MVAEQSYSQEVHKPAYFAPTKTTHGATIQYDMGLKPAVIAFDCTFLYSGQAGGKLPCIGNVVVDLRKLDFHYVNN